MHLTPQPSLVEQAYDAMLDEIADGTLPPNTHLIQELLAARYGVSRQPIQQALLLLKNDGMVQDAGRRGLVVAPLDPDMMHDRYQVRGALEALAARLAAGRCGAAPKLAERVRREGERILEAGRVAVAAADVKAMIAQDVGFHAFVSRASGNAVIGPTAEVHWRFARRVMGEVLRRSEPRAGIWEEHRAILEAIVAGDGKSAEASALGHIDNVARQLKALATTMKNDTGRERADGRRHALDTSARRPRGT